MCDVIFVGGLQWIGIHERRLGVSCPHAWGRYPPTPYQGCNHDKRSYLALPILMLIDLLLHYGPPLMVGVECGMCEHLMQV